MFRKLLYLFSFLIVLVGLCVCGALYWFVVLHPGDEIDHANIQRILGKETPVFFSDGKIRLGTFFDQAHRQYVVYEQIPKDFVNALVASEDNSFFTHFGFDPSGIIRAVIKNYQAGRVVQGGSTITQQTAKNLFKRSGRSYQAKIKELLLALRLEYHYPKEKIFEFYANQFYVSGNGHGLGVAARYYFNKPVETLSLLECAFIAGSVKKPNFYNPFIKKTDEAVKSAHEQANIRTRYVIEKMHETGVISDEQLQEALESDVEFHQGTIGYAQDYVMDMVTDAVSTSEVLEALKAQGIENLATSGLHVITTVDEGLQRQTLYSLRQELSRLDVRLRGYERAEVEKELREIEYSGDMELKQHAFLFGTIEKITRSVEDGKTSVQINVDLGRKLGTGVIREQGLMGLLVAQMKWKQGRWNTATVKDLPLLLSELQEGGRVWVSVREISADGGVELELEKYPKIQGGALILQDGLVKGMAGGVENRFFNRAIYAKRTMGSAFKPFVFSAALQLGWNATDLLNNKRDVFVFQGQPYFPRPDHKSENSQVSMSWAGVHSENLASVWLLYHLCDHLSTQQFQEVAYQVGLSAKKLNGETDSYETYAARIRDRHGIIVNRAVLENAAYDQAVTNLETDFIFENRLQEYTALKSLRYESVKAGAASQLDVQLQDKKLTEQERQEIHVRKSLLAGQNYLALVALHQELLSYRRNMENPWGFVEMSNDQEGQGKAFLYYDQTRDKYIFSRGGGGGGLQAVDTVWLRESLLEQDSAEQEKFWSEVSLASQFSSETISMVRRQVDIEFKRLSALPPYSLEVLSAVQDFRILVGLRYLINFARELGIKSQLDPVLSFPLGSNVVTLLEFVRMYEGLVTGEVVLSEGGREDSRDLLSIIDRIESSEGEILYQPKRKRNRVVAPETSLVVGHILENIVKFGTGRDADKNVRLKGIDEDSSKKFAGFDLAIPLLGKTGTANNYTNASFFGYLPGLTSQGELVNKGGYAVGVYVGFDDNEDMRRSSTRITGSEGALPTWIELVRVLLKEKGYGQQLDPVEISFSGLALQRDALGQLNLAVEANRGGVLPSYVSEVDAQKRTIPSIMDVGERDDSGRFVPLRQFKPYWRVKDPSVGVNF